MVARDVHPLNEFSDIVDFPISIDFNEVHPLNAFAPMFVEVVEVEEELKVTFVSDVHPLNASAPTEVMLLRSAFVKYLQFLKALALIDVYLLYYLVQNLYYQNDKLLHLQKKIK